MKRQEDGFGLWSEFLRGFLNLGDKVTGFQGRGDQMSLEMENY